MRIVFMGTPDFSVPALKALVEAGHQVIAVVTQPDKPKGRGKEVQMTPVKIQAMEYGIPVYQPAKVREASFVEVLKGLEADVYVVISLWPDSSKGSAGASEVRLHQHPRVPAPEVPGRCAYPVVCHRR